MNARPETQLPATYPGFLASHDSVVVEDQTGSGSMSLGIGINGAEHDGS